MKSLPVAIIDSKRLTDSQIITYAGSFASGLLAQVLIFPLPPFDSAALTALITAYKTAYANAVKGSKLDTENKLDAKEELIQAMKSDVTYVNQIVNAQYSTVPSVNYATLRALILSVGLKTKKIVTRPNTLGNSRIAQTISAIAKLPGKGGVNVNGTMKIRVKAAKKYDSAAVKTFWLQYRTPAVPASGSIAAVPAGPWIAFMSTSSRITVPFVASGQYEYQIAPIIGIYLGKNQLNWSQIQTVIVT